MSRLSDAPNCPGCRVGCRIDRFLCGRGARQYDRWLAGEPLEDVKLAISAEAQVARVLPLAATMLERSVHEGDCQRVAHFLATHGGFASRRLVESRTGARDPQVLESLCEKGYAAVEPDGRGGHIVRLTPAGARQERRWRDELDESCSEFCSPLDADERQKLVDLLFKLSSPH